MRIELTLERISAANLLPLNYQYELASWLYRVLHTASPAFSRFLHQEGYLLKGRRFKLFTFSQLRVERYQMLPAVQRFAVQSETVQLTVSFFLGDAAETFLKGLFMSQELRLGDRRWTCQGCGSEHDRDENAAKNIRDRAWSRTVGDVRREEIHALAV